jgi:Holliday junction resolvase RusA-like endonuclease
MIKFIVEGQPVPKGSTHAIVIKGRAITLQNGLERLRPWTEVVKWKAREAGVALSQGAVGLKLTFYMKPPKSLKPGRAMISRPDVDKLTRATLDALTGIAYVDDSQVTKHFCVKKWAEAQGKERTEIEVYQ